MTTPRPSSADVDIANPSPAPCPEQGPEASPSPVRRAVRPWIGVYFSCSNTYTRVSRSPDVRTYLARCPKCGKSVRFRVGPGGSNARFFEVSC